MSRFPSAPDYRRLFVVKSTSIRFLCLTALVIGVFVPRPVSAALIMRIDTNSDMFFIEGSDTGNAEYQPDDPLFPEQGGSYALQFIHFFSTTVPQFGTITTSAQNLFVQGTTLPMNGHMYMVSNSGQNYVFMDLFGGSSDITSLTGMGPSAALSYAGLPAADIPVFESLVGNNLVLNIGTGYSPMSVQAVPEPSTYAMACAGLACGGFSMWRRRKRA